jgi:hypothetical protein
MTDYRIYVIGRDGHFLRSIELVCPNDEAAKAETEQLLDGHDLELWQLGRKVAFFASKEPEE